jgi:hypothetical protein
MKLEDMGYPARKNMFQQHVQDFSIFSRLWQTFNLGSDSTKVYSVWK